MYHQHYGFLEDPFLLSPNHKFCLWHPSFSEAKVRMEDALQREEGFVVITGEPGTGKTTLIEGLLEELNRSDINIAKLAGARLDGDDILLMVGYAFRIPVDGLDKAQILQRIQQYAESDFKRGRRSLLIIDEAQGLTHGALEELRLLTELRIDGKSILQIFLIGQDELRGQLMDKRLEQLGRRIVAACHMEPLTLEQTLLYVLHRLSVAGWRGNPKLNPDLFPFLHEFSQGIPRRINIACSRMLLQGALEQQSELTAKDIRLVISELQSERLHSAATPSHIDINAFDLEHLAELIEQNTPNDSAPRFAQRVEVEPSPAPVMDISSLIPAAEPEPVSSIESAEQAGLLDVSILQPRGKRRQKRGMIASLWRLSAILLLMLSVIIAGLISVPSEVLRRIAPDSFWAEVGVTKARDLLFRWSDGALPLQQLPQPVEKVSQNSTAPILIERRAKPEVPDSHAGLPDPHPKADTPVAVAVIPQAEVQPEPVKVIPKVKPETGTEKTETPSVRKQSQSPKKPVKAIPKVKPDTGTAKTEIPSVPKQSQSPEKPVKAIPKVKPETGTEKIETPPVGKPPQPQKPPTARTVMQVSFGFDSVDIQAEFQELLDELAISLTAREESKAQIIGFTDSAGDPRYNALLSKRRAEAVANYLRNRGVAEQQLQIEGRGEMVLQGDQKEKPDRNRVVRVYTH